MLPNFFILGAPKCGTTSLASWLSEHPKIFMSPIKEPFYFSSDINYQKVKLWEDYKMLFKDAKPEHISVGEASTYYLFSKIAVPSIEKKLPKSRYIVMLRNPVEMAPALHEQRIRSFIEDNADFQWAWTSSPERRIGKNVPMNCNDPVLLDYQSWCQLGHQLERLFLLVDRERVLILILDDIKENPHREYLRTLKFLGVNDDGRNHFPILNPARERRFVRFGKLIRGLGLWLAWARHVARILPKRGFGIVSFLGKLTMRERQRKPIPVDFLRELEAYYFEDIKLLEKLTGRSFNSWTDHLKTN